MKVTIGIRDAATPLYLDLNLSQAELAEKLNNAVLNNGILELTDTDESTVLVPHTSIGYIHISKEEQRRVGFGFGAN
ncbi:MAG: DUF3107 domain-containing protein [Arcanobacterium sp.]|nr:DUF3107 domain-containing protein [Arcanobacterium sp.]